MEEKKRKWRVEESGGQKRVERAGRAEGAGRAPNVRCLFFNWNIFNGIFSIVRGHKEKL